MTTNFKYFVLVLFTVLSFTSCNSSMEDLEQQNYQVYLLDDNTGCERKSFAPFKYVITSRDSVIAWACYGRNTSLTKPIEGVTGDTYTFEDFGPATKINYVSILEDGDYTVTDYSRDYFPFKRFEDASVEIRGGQIIKVNGYSSVQWGAFCRVFMPDNVSSKDYMLDQINAIKDGSGNYIIEGYDGSQFPTARTYIVLSK